MVSEGKIWKNGRIYRWEGLSNSVGFRQGDGVFETLRTYKGVPFLLHEHAARLLEGAGLLGIKDLPSLDIVEETVLEHLKSSTHENASDERVVRFALFHDERRWGFAVSTAPWNPAPSLAQGEGLITGYSPYPHPGRYLIPPGSEVQVKWLSRGPLSHALRDAKAKGWDESLLINQSGEVVEGTRSNIFAVDDSILFAPGPKSYALPGITRRIVVESATEIGLEVADQPVPVEVLEASDEIFITSSLLGIAPISRIVNGSYSRERVGKITTSLMKIFNDRFSKELRL